MSATSRESASLLALRDALRIFAKERDWDQFHSPKNLTMALTVEAAELLEHFQWLTVEEAANLTAAQKEAVSLELADVLLYLVRLADKLDVDLLQSASRKLEINAKKYPIGLAFGSRTKYSELK